MEHKGPSRNNLYILLLLLLAAAFLPLAAVAATPAPAWSAAQASARFRELDDRFHRTLDEDRESLAGEAGAELLRELDALSPETLPPDIRTDYRCVRRYLEFRAAWAALSDGDDPDSRRARYQATLRHIFGVDWTVSEYLERATYELHRLRWELEELGRGIKGGGSFRDALQALKAQAPTDYDGLADLYRDGLRGCLDFVLEHDLATLPPKAREVDLKRTASGQYPYAYYTPEGWRHGKGPGTVWVCTPPLLLDGRTRRMRLRANYPAMVRFVALHEAVPGHHLQHTVWHERAGRDRHLLRNPALVEGWGLYAESLMGRAGYCRTPEERFGMLHMRAWRAARVVINIGLQVNGMTRDEAARVLIDELGMEPVIAYTEVDNHIERGSYHAGYLAGCMTLEALRDEVRAILGDRYAEAWYHDTVLEFGPVPLDILQEGVLEAARDMAEVTVY